MLVVEDDFISRFSLNEMLAAYGTCEIAANGLEAVEAVATRLKEDRPYTLICLDIMLPEMDGYEVLRRIRKLEEAHGRFGHARARVVMTTALGAIDNVMLAFNEQCDGYLVKPVSAAQLTTQLKKLSLISG